MVDTPEEEKALNECVQGHVVKLCMDSQGTHVMQKYVKVTPKSISMLTFFHRHSQKTKEYL